jgi:hypothetical protein
VSRENENKNPPDILSGGLEPIALNRIVYDNFKKWDTITEH